MRTLAEALLHVAAFLELSGDDAVDPDAAVSAMEAVAWTLRGCTPEERDALREAAQRLAGQADTAEGADFFDGFMRNAGLDSGKTRKGASRRASALRAKNAGKSVTPAILHDFWKAIQSGELEAVASLLKAHPSLSRVAAPKNAITGLQWAAQAGQAGVLKLLLDAGADVAAADAEGDTALHWSALGRTKGYRDCASLLLANGADRSVRNKAGQTPRQKAAAFGKNPVLLGARR